MKRCAVAALALACCVQACAGETQSDDELSATRGELAAATAAGVVPAGLPARVLVGVFEDSGQTWMRNSGVSWGARYRYFTKGWVNNWGWGAYDGSWGLAYLRECDQQGYVPAVQYYQIVGEPGGSESAMLSKVQNATTMRSYFGDFKILMQRVKDFGKPALILLEADGYGFLQQQTSSNPNAYAAVAASGVPELAGLPNTVAGWGLAFLQLRKAVGASNAILGVHISAWASGKDIAYFNVTDALGPEVDKVYAFLAPLGLGANATGQSYDLLVGDPLDRDSDYYRLVQNQNRWWDASDSASIASRSFNRYAEWLRLWNQKASKRWVLWQIPIGNSNHKNVNNNGGSAEGYKDNRSEYFFANGTAHIAKFADAGVIALLFGAGAGGQSSYQNDTYSDGQLFLRSRATTILNAGGVPIADGRGSGGGGSGGSGGSGGGSAGSAGGSAGTAAAGSGGTGGSSSDASRYGFETSTQGWSSSGGMLTSVTSSGDRAFAGVRSLKLGINGAASSQRARVATPSAGRSATVTFHVYLPAGSAISAVQPYVLQGASGNWRWTGTWRSTGSLSANQWNTLTVQVPSDAATPLAELGVEITTNASWTGAAYVDTVNW